MDSKTMSWTITILLGLLACLLTTIVIEHAGAAPLEQMEPRWQCVKFPGCWFIPSTGTGADSWQWVPYLWREEWWQVKELWHPETDWHYVR